jgi:hypothetical protein
MKKEKLKENYLEKTPVKNPVIKWSSNDDGIVTLEIENKGIMKRITQKLFKKPKVSYIHLDENGSFIWNLIDGESNLIDIGVKVEEHFGDSAHPIYERLARFFQVLESCNFITFK